MTVARTPGLHLASLHLRLGSPSLARAELEALAIDRALDAQGRVDLVEARWRSGDLSGAGDLAKSILATGDEPVVALVVAAEAAAALGRPTEARRLAGRALDLDRAGIDRIFAGVPRSSVWPSDPSEPLPPPETLFPTERHLQEPVEAAVRDPDLDLDLAPDDAAAPAPDGPGLWDGDDGTTAAEPYRDRDRLPGSGSSDDIEANRARLVAGRAALAAGDPGSAALHLGLLVRVAPDLASEVIDALVDHDDPALLMVRGDALRVVGRESEARAAYERATGGL